MKKYSCLVAALLSFNIMAETSIDTDVKYVGDLEYARFCKAIVTNDMRLLKTSLSRKVGVLAPTRDDVLHVLLDKKMTCNGADLIEFSKRRNATDILAYITARS
ncbi:hypothetical protein [Aestuariibacter salexigens]|uniref:hypothetical protein n=1 Tax=Aestuariibacter salexigens TaxID=226010 RepID=UPI0004122E02|nr:hypothetical protein [Aestuariibacter salexigens]